MALADGPRTAPGYMVNGALYGQAVQDVLETVRDVAWPQSIETYSRMRRDPQVGATLNAYMLPLLSAHWAIDPAGCRDEVAQYAADAWGLPILGVEDKPTGFRKRGVLFEEHIRLALLQLVYGHMPFVWAGEIKGNPTRWRLTTLAERLPHTISEIQVNDDGTLKGIVQYGEDVPIPSANLLWYVHNREGANWAGTSMLREAYGPWLLKHDMWRVLGISSRRFGMGVPNVNAPAGATDAEIEKAARLAESIRVGDQAGAGLPDGFHFNLTGLTGSVPDTLGFVKYLDSQIAQGVLASVLNLSESATGNRALGEVLVGLLRQAWGGVAREIAIPAGRLTARMVDINFGEDEPSPNLVCQGLGRPEPTAEAIKGLLDAGAIHADPALENWTREQYDLPAYAGEDPHNYLADDPNRPDEPSTPPALLPPGVPAPVDPNAPTPAPTPPAGAPSGGKQPAPVGGK